MSVAKAEVELLAARFRDAERTDYSPYVAAVLEALQATIERMAEEESVAAGIIERKKTLIAGLVDAALAANKERDLLRAVVRCADYFIVAGQDSRYDEARKALVNFDKAKR